MSTFLFSCPDEECGYTLHDIETSTLNCNKAKKKLVTKYLAIYSQACTTAIILTACNDCGSLSEECESEFSASELMDPEFPLTMDDEPKKNVGEYLSEYTCSRLEEVVDVIGAMEDSWDKRVTTMTPEQFRIAKKLWEMGRDLGSSRIENSQGYKMSQEFKEIGDDLF